MTTTQKYTLGAGVFVLLALLVLLYVLDIFKINHLFGSSGKRVGEVVESRNEVRRKSSGEFTWSGVEQREKLYFKDTIYSGAGAEAVLDILDNSRIEMGANTIIVLDRNVLDQFSQQQNSDDIQVSLVEGKLRILNANDQDDQVLAGKKQARKLKLQLNADTDIELNPGDEFRLQIKDTKANILLKTQKQTILVNGKEKKLKTKYVVWDNVEIKNSQNTQKASLKAKKPQGLEGFEVSNVDELVQNDDERVRELAEKIEERARTDKNLENQVVKELTMAEGIELSGELLKNAVELSSEEEYQQLAEVIESRSDLLFVKEKLAELNKPTNLLSFKNTELLLKQADTALRVNDFDRAIRDYSKILQSHFDHPQALMGLKAAQSGKEQEEISAAEQAQIMQQARAALMGESYTEAAEFFLRVLRANPEHKGALEGLGLAAKAEPVKKMSAVELAELREELAKVQERQDYHLAAQLLGYLYHSQEGSDLTELQVVYSQLEEHTLSEKEQNLNLVKAANALRAGHRDLATGAYMQILRKDSQHLLAQQGLLAASEKFSLLKTKLAEANAALARADYAGALQIYYALRQVFPANLQVSFAYQKAELAYKNKKMSEPLCEQIGELFKKQGRPKILKHRMGWGKQIK